MCKVPSLPPKITMGVTQGSMLGSLLLLVCINSRDSSKTLKNDYVYWFYGILLSCYSPTELQSNLKADCLAASVSLYQTLENRWWHSVERFCSVVIYCLVSSHHICLPSITLRKTSNTLRSSTYSKWVTSVHMGPESLYPSVAFSCQATVFRQSEKARAECVSLGQTLKESDGRGSLISLLCRNCDSSILACTEVQDHSTKPAGKPVYLHNLCFQIIIIIIIFYICKKRFLLFKKRILLPPVQIKSTYGVNG